MDGLGSRFLNTVIAVVAIFGLLTFVFIFQETNNAPIENRIISSPIISQFNSSFSNIINDKTQTIQSINASMQSGNEISYGWVVIKGIINLGFSAVSIPFSLWFAMVEGVSTIFGIPTYYLNIIGGAMALVLFLLVIRMWRQGS